MLIIVAIISVWVGWSFRDYCQEQSEYSKTIDTRCCGEYETKITFYMPDES